jgi:hypothetical protein
MPMPLSWNEIKDRALRFSREWADESSEDAEAQTFLNGFFEVFGVTRRRLATFEKKVKKIDGRDGYIDLLWKGKLLVEQKSRGKDLDRAHAQARDYFHGLTDAELPRYLLVSDFARFRLYDLEGNAPPMEFALKDLHKHVRAFGFIAGYQARTFKDEDPVNIEAAERMGKLHDALKTAGYAGHDLEVLLVRLLFCLFAEDTGIFETAAFHDLIAQRTAPDGADLGLWLGQLFQTLNKDVSQRQTTLDAQLAEFPYVNGKLFAKSISLAAFDAKMRALLLDASALNWSLISPAIFGAMFQSVMDAKARRNLGAHYTSEKNILKLIGPLFLDDLKAELQRIGNSDGRLRAFHAKLADLRFLDPACGCGNFLVIAYRELRLLELEVLRRLHPEGESSRALWVSEEVQVDVDQFYGIELEEFPAQIAQVALWLMDHQMNMLVSEAFGNYFVRLPLKKSATIVNDNALRVDWNAIVPRERLSYILGNPPFGGKHYQSREQRTDQASVTAGIKSGSDLDFVANWFIKAANYSEDTVVDFAFVATNSITQGEQVPLLWPYLLDQRKLRIRFAHRTFKWSNEARGKAAVHCVIVGMSRQPVTRPCLYDYDTPTSEPHLVVATNINPYLADGPNVVVTKRSSPLDERPTMRCGSKPSDDGQLILSDAQRNELVASYPITGAWIRPYIGSEEFINGKQRWCLWLKDVPPSALRSVPPVLERIEAVRAFREESSAAPTRAAAQTPARFFFVSQPDTDYILVPEVSSERRRYVPIGWMTSDTISSNKNYIVAEPSRCIFGLLQSAMHMAWLGTVAGRLESRFQYSASMVYNNFPWPQPLEDKARAAIEAAAQGVLDARALFPDATLADLYDPLTMPPALVKAHQALDRAVDAAYAAAEKAEARKPPKLASDAERVAFLFECYQALTSLLPAEKPKRTARKRSRA